MAIDSSRARRGPRRPRLNGHLEVRTELDEWTRRLRANGATQEEIAASVAVWDDLDGEWTAEMRSEMVRWTDRRIREELAAVRSEYEEHTGP